MLPLVVHVGDLPVARLGGGQNILVKAAEIQDLLAGLVHDDQQVAAAT